MPLRIENWALKVLREKKGIGPTKILVNHWFNIVY
jgi:hypothetical protein